jgi:CBS domain-containing protein
MLVGQVMTRNPATCRADDSLQHAAQLMWERDCGFVPVVDDQGCVVGVVTDRDACMGAYTQGRPLWDIPVSTAMARDVCVCHPEEDIGRALDVMRRRQVRRLPVIDNLGRLLGVLSLRDAALGGAATVEIADAFRDICQCAPPRAAA